MGNQLNTKKPVENAVKKSRIPRVFRSRNYINAMTASIIGIVAGVFVSEGIALAIIGIWSLEIGKNSVRANIDAYKGQYFDKENSTIKSVHENDEV